MIIHTHELLIPGQIVNGPDAILWDRDLVAHRGVAFKVIRKATRKEYLEFCESEGVLGEVNPIKLIGALYYEIHMD
jgi:hypothetical protein